MRIKALKTESHVGKFFITTKHEIQIQVAKIREKVVEAIEVEDVELKHRFEFVQKFQASIWSVFYCSISFKAIVQVPVIPRYVYYKVVQSDQ